MKLLAVIAPLFVLFAQTVQDPGLLSALTNAGGMGLLSAALFYLHISQQKMHKEELAENRKELVTAIKEVTKAVQELTDKLTDKDYV